MSDEYIAIFCPRCGEHLNEVDLDVEDERAKRAAGVTSNMGSPVTCGWCHEQTRDWNHIVRCRRTINIRRHRDMNRMGLELAEMLEEMRG